MLLTQDSRPGVIPRMSISYVFQKGDRRLVQLHRCVKHSLWTDCSQLLIL